MPFRLFQCIAKAVAKNGIKFVCGLIPGGGVLYDIAADAWEDYRQAGQDDAMRAEVAALAQAPADKVRQEAQAAIHAFAADQPPEVQQAFAAYLNRLPAVIRSSLRRPSDPTGTTIPPTLSLSRPEDLLAFLPARPPRFKPGDQPKHIGNWELVELLGAGGFGEVWKARHAYLHAKPPVALKFCLDASAAPALRNEVGMLNRVMQHGYHPGIVRLVQTYLDADPPCLEYEYVEGGDLAGLIQELHGQRQMTPDMAIRLVLDLAEIVAHAHGANPPIVHGDLKPANILVQRDADNKVVLRVTDFGIGGLAAAKAVRETRQPTHSRQSLLTEAVKGAYTPLYASPQQMKRVPGEPADPRDDIHALGVIWYQALTGDLAAMTIPADWQEEVQERGLREAPVKLLASCMAAKAEKRPANAVILAAILRGLVGPPEEKGGEFRTVLDTITVQRQPLVEDRQAFLEVVQGYTSAATRERYARILDDLVRWSEAHAGALELQPRGQRQQATFAYRLAGEPVIFWDAYPRKADGAKFIALPDLPSQRVPEELREKLRQAFAKFENQQTGADKPIPTLSFRTLEVEETRNEVKRCLEEALASLRPLGLYTNSLGMKFAWIPPGAFVMGSPVNEPERSDDETQHKVTLTKGFHLGIHQVTQTQWQAVMGDNPSHFKGESNLPVEKVSWDECMAFCKALGQKDGQTYRLPTEAEWEYACRAGTTTPFHFGGTICTNQVNHNNSRRKTTPVGSFPDNAWGLYDMHGNVWEWCADWYGPYPEAELKDPQGFVGGDARVVRGGSYFDQPGLCHSAHRAKRAPGRRHHYLGCRVALCLD